VARLARDEPGGLAAVPLPAARPGGRVALPPDAPGRAAARVQADARGDRARLVEIDDVGHAWSGGDASLPFNDAAGPDATAMAGAFLDLVWGRAPA
jgi:poly(3-hydroxybutyrate) depolymerase